MQEELFDLVDEEGRVTGRATRSACHSDRRLLHPVVHLHLFDAAGRLYLQLRSANKKVLPGYWDTAVGGHLASGENAWQALLREAREELGIDASGARFLYNFIWRGRQESEYVYAYSLTCSDEPRPDPGEVAGGRFFTRAQLLDWQGPAPLTPNFSYEYQRWLPIQYEVAWIRRHLGLD